ncbi:bifunctional metallophosphatase/5'-nucleotidase [Methylovirgula sp. 4M-Z18]|uniref:bifunctional metallophosphatase/5'-nucleotidase n=1 Tax=Methylovirgula sp. 4M-Z18 TaxID=2293567 RepID=UPI000E2EEC26|nr:bifunctional UDP-sugar hydrolase/5'-nucleotidase [Methylovirgula sp. 4M-Z18]RFB81610.1 bifunctional metallophosphatase/5'-nucleotidase [Methylovirgula sp. 4M-Z18]
MTDLSRRGLLGGALAAGATVIMSRSAALAADSVKISFVLTNDVYNMDGVKGRGGLPRLAAAIKAERDKGGNVLFSHAGDTFSPSVMSSFDMGAHMVALFNALQLDLFVPGNHEFDFGKDVYFKRIGEAKFPILAANLRAADGSMLPQHQDSMLIEKGGIKLGLVGTALEQTPDHSSPGDLVFSPTVDAIRREAQTLRAQGADLIVAICHCERDLRERLMDLRVADLIITGHTHDVHIDYNGRALTAESGEDAIYVVILDLSVDVKDEGGKRTIAWWPNYRIIDSTTLTPDADVQVLVKHLEADLSKELDVVIGALGAPLDSRSATVRGGEAAIGNLVADALRTKTNADCAITNGGGIRANKQYPAGTQLTRRDILAELPFGNKTTVTRISGKAIRAALENGLSQFENRAGRFPQVSGLKIIASAAAPAGARVQSVEIDGQMLDDAKTYTVATNDFMLRGGDGYTALQDKNATADTGDSLMANDVMDYIKKLGTVNETVEGRVVVQ